MKRGGRNDLFHRGNSNLPDSGLLFLCGCNRRVANLNCRNHLYFSFEGNRAMTILYNCRHDGDQYRITKFDDAMNVESSYLCAQSPSACQCPAFEKRNKCRHMEMLPQFISRNHIGDEWFLDFD